MKILVTGGAGFIGSHCVDALLLLGHEVCVVDNLLSGREINLDFARKLASEKKIKFEFVNGDISKPEVWDQLAKSSWDGMFHLAAQTSVTAAVENPELDFRINVDSVNFICNWARKTGLKYLVYANTAGAMYGAAEEFPTSENHPCRPTTPYGATKNFFESYLGSLARSLKASGVWSSNSKEKNYFSWLSLRLANVYGPRQITKGEAGVIPIFIEALRDGRRPTIFGNGSKTRDYVYVGDIARAFVQGLQILNEKCIDEGVNVGTGIETSDKEVFDSVRDSIRQTKTSLPGFDLATLDSPLLAAIRPGEIERSCLNNQRAKQVLAGFVPKVAFRDGVDQTVRAYLS